MELSVNAGFYYIGQRGKVCCVDLKDLSAVKRVCALGRSFSIKVTAFPSGHRLSTVLLPASVSFAEGAKPVVFETMLFDPCGQSSELAPVVRYHHRFEAKRGHRRLVNLLAKKLGGYGCRVPVGR